MLEVIVEFIQGLPVIGVLAFAFAITFVENIFPPSPSDVVLVFCGTLAGVGTVGFVPLLLSSTAGSVLGFLAMYYIGSTSGKRMVKKGKVPFGADNVLKKVEQWFQKYGYGLIVANRFLSGTRAIISFFAGLANLSLPKTLALSAVSALVWNAILLQLGVLAGENWQSIQFYLAGYGKTVTGVIIVVVLVLAIRWFVSTQNQGAAK